MPVNVELLREVADKIEAEPQLYYQAAWASVLTYLEGKDRAYYLQYVPQTSEFNICGTAHCIAGWAMVLSGWTPLHIKTTLRGRSQVGIRWAEPGSVEPAYHQPLESGEGATLLGLNPELQGIFGGAWSPREGLSVPGALRAIAAGATYWDVTLWFSDPELADQEPIRLPIEEVQAMAEVR